MVDAAAARTLAVLTRAPSPAGQSGGKTRLFAALGCAPDQALLTALLLDTLAGADAADVARIVAVTPASACGDVASILPAGVGVMPQPPGTLGERMRDTLALLLASGARAVVLIGSDVPAITPAIITAAFEILERDRGTIVLGPAEDGGYYLVGATRVPPIFEGIDWGTAAVLGQTTAAAAARGIRVSLVDTLTDVDTPRDLEAVAMRLPFSRTAAWWRGGRTEGRQ